MDTRQLIYQDDFVSAKIKIKIKNLISQTSIDSETKIVGGRKAKKKSSENYRIEITEIMQSGLVLSIPSLLCAVGHTLEVDILVLHMSDKPLHICIPCQVKELEHASKTEDRILVEFKNIENIVWKKFCNLFLNRQQAIDEFFSNVRGY